MFLSKFVRAPDSKTTSFAHAILPISELPPPELRNGNRLTEIVRQQKEEIRREAYNEGYREGMQQGQEDGFHAAKTHADHVYSEEIAAFVSRLQAVEAKFDETIERFIGEAEQQLAALAIVIAERLMRVEMEAGREAAVAIAKEAINEVRHGVTARIRVNPFDGGEVAARQGEILAAAQGLRSIEIVRDPKILGGCVIESEDGLIDARIEEALRRLVEAARGLRPSEAQITGDEA